MAGKAHYSHGTYQSPASCHRLATSHWRKRCRCGLELGHPTDVLTLNGGGLNGLLAFPCQEYFPDKYQDNEVAIFNCRGDFVFQDKPYNNDWDGANQDGVPLPEGTYYYTLRIKLDDGLVKSGHVLLLTE